MVITTAGYGNTGSSAVLDFLKGYQDLAVFDKVEFQLIHMPDGINDLKYHIAISKERISTNAAVQRFRRAALNSLFGRRMKKYFGEKYVICTEEYIKSVTCVTWNGGSRYDPTDVTIYAKSRWGEKVYDCVNAVVKRLNSAGHFPRFKERCFSVMSEDEFDANTKVYLQNIIRLLNENNYPNVVLDMLVSGTNPSMGAEFFDGLKTIIVYRDPRDLFIRATEHQSTNGPLPCARVEDFVVYYRCLMEQSERDESILYIQYEDLIYKYYETTKTIMDYLGYDHRPENEFKYFDPDISVKYTKAGDTYPGHDEEIRFIEKELPEYLYTFGKYVPVAEQKNKTQL